MVKLGSTLESSRKDKRLANSDNIYDKRLGKMQEEINQEVFSLSPVDEEDLTRSYNDNGRSVTKFADRSYSPQNFSGKGYKILRKNIKPVTLAVTKIVVSSVPTSDGYMSFIINGVESHVDVIASSDTTTDKVADKIVAKLTETMTEYEVSKDASTITLTRKFGSVISTPSSFSAVNTGASCSITDSTKKELRNILTPIIMNQPNTIYEIRYDFDANGETINIPENCVLKFEGGSLNNGKIDLNYCEIINGKIYLIPVSLPINHTFKVSDFGICDKSEASYNSAIIQAMMDIEGRKEIYFDSTGIIEFDKEINWTLTNIRGRYRNAHIQLLKFPNSSGFVAQNTIAEINIRNISVSSKFNTFQINSGYILHFDNVEAISTEGSCFVGNIGTKVFECTFNNVRVNATTGKYCFDHFCGNTMVFSNINAWNAGISIFNYCAGSISGCNGCWDKTPHFVTTNSDNFNDTLSYMLSLFIEQTNIESYKDVLFDLTGNSIGGFRLYLGENVSLYLAPKVNGKYEKPYIKANGLILRTAFPMKYDETEWKESIYPVMTSTVGHSINNLKCEGDVDVYLTDKNKMISFKRSHIEDSILKSSYTREKGVILQGINRVIDLDHIYLNRCFFKETNIIYPSNTEKLQLDVTTAQSFIISRNSSEDIEETKEIQLFNHYIPDGINYGELKQQYDFVTITNKAINTSFKIRGSEYFGSQNPTLAPNESCVFANYAGNYICISINKLSNIRSYKNNIPDAPSINGACFYNEELKKVVYSYNSSWVDALGNNALVKYNGTTQQRPTGINSGFQYFDTTINKSIWWTGTKWVDNNGNPADAKKLGTTEERPTAINIGFIYKDTTLNKLIIWSGSSWVNMDGTKLATST